MFSPFSLSENKSEEIHFIISSENKRKNIILLKKQKVFSLKVIIVFLYENEGQGSCVVRKEWFSHL